MAREIGVPSPFKQLHDQIIRSVFLTDVIQGADVRMVERGDDFRFALKALAEGGIVRHRGRKHLDGNMAARRVSLARNTSPIPPAPIGVTISYGPRREPGVMVMGCAIIPSPLHARDNSLIGRRDGIRECGQDARVPRTRRPRSNQPATSGNRLLTASDRRTVGRFRLTAEALAERCRASTRYAERACAIPSSGGTSTNSSRREF